MDTATSTSNGNGNASTQAPAANATPQAKATSTGKAKASKAPATTPATNGKPQLAGKALLVLQHLAAAGQAGATRKQLARATGKHKGWAKLLGAHTKGAPTGLQAAGLVATVRNGSSLVHVCTKAGLAAITAAGAKPLPMPKAAK